jgi:[acyl-carrier-protein] S-malonyltransferase
VIFFLFPGQGSQAPGMGQDLHEASDAARRVFDAATALMAPDFLEVLFGGSDAAVTDTRFAQPALVITEIATARHLESLGLHPSGCAGHSVGEFAALVIAGALAFEDAVRLTQARGRLMAQPEAPGGMAAVLGLPAEEIAAALPDGAEIANFNGPHQTIISGTTEALRLAETALRAAGARRVIALKVSGPFHSTLMRGAGEAFRSEVADIPIRAPRVPFVSSVSGAFESDPARIRTLLWQQISRPVQWTDVMRAIGAVQAAECGPGNVLQGLAKRTPGAPHVSPAGTVAAAEALEVAEVEAEELKEG